MQFSPLSLHLSTILYIFLSILDYRSHIENYLDLILNLNLFLINLNKNFIDSDTVKYLSKRLILKENSQIKIREALTSLTFYLLLLFLS
jgi:hypothetical protein